MPDSHYRLNVFWEPGNKCIVEVPELPDCTAQGATRAEAIANAEFAIDEWLEKAKNKGLQVLQPKVSYSWDENKNKLFTACFEAEPQSSREIERLEHLTWILHEKFPPAGSLILAERLLTLAVSFLNLTIKPRQFARDLIGQCVPQLLEKPERDYWDNLVLGLCYLNGRGVPQDYTLAAQVFDTAAAEGLWLGRYHAIWARHLAGGSRLEAIWAFSRISKGTPEEAGISADRLALIAEGPVREAASTAHFVRLNRFYQALHHGCGHTHGDRLIRLAIEKELRESVPELMRLSTPRAFLALYFVARFSRVNPTGESAQHWFDRAVDPALEEMQSLCRQEAFTPNEMKLILQRAKSEGWLEAPLAIEVTKVLNRNDR